MNNLQKGILLTLIATILNSSTYIITKYLLNITNVETVLILWFFWGNLIFILFFLFKKDLKKIFAELKSNIRKLVIFGVIGSIGIISWTYAILYGETTNIAFIFRLEAVFAVIFGLALLKEKIFPLEWIGMVLAIVGAFIMVYSGSISLDKGTIAILISALTSAFSIFLAKVYVKGISAYALTYTRTISALIFISIYALSMGRFEFSLQSNVLGFTFLTAFVGAFLGFLLFYKSLSLYEMSKAIAVRSTEPFFVAIFGLIILMTIPTINQIIGGTLIVVGVIIISLMGKNKNGNTKNIKAK